MHVFAFIGIALAVGFVSPAWAAQTYRTKDVYFAGDTKAPERVKTYLRDRPGEAIQVDTFTRIGMPMVETFHAFGPLSRSPAGVCRYTRTHIFPHSSDGGQVSWDSVPPRPGVRVDRPAVMAIVADLPCPSQETEGYTSIDGAITDEEFVEVTGFWKTVAASSGDFDRASGLLPFILRPSAAGKFEEFRGALFAPDRTRPVIRALWREGIDTYAVALAEPGADAPRYFVSVSKSVSGFDLLNFQTPY